MNKLRLMMAVVLALSLIPLNPASNADAGWLFNRQSNAAVCVGPNCPTASGYATQTYQGAFGRTYVRTTPVVVPLQPAVPYGSFNGYGTGYGDGGSQGGFGSYSSNSHGGSGGYGVPVQQQSQPAQQSKPAEEGFGAAGCNCAEQWAELKEELAEIKQRLELLEGYSEAKKQAKLNKSAAPEVAGSLQSRWDAQVDVLDSFTRMVAAQ